MKKNTSILIVASALLSSIPFKAEAFLLPPFKTDVVNSLQKSFTTIKTKVEKAYKTVMESTFVQTVIQYGEGAKEAYEFVKINNINSIQSLLSQYPQFSNIAAKYMKIDLDMSEAKGKATKEISSIVESSNAKINSLNIDINKLQEDILKDPSHAVINNERITELLRQKNNLIFSTQDNITNIKDVYSMAVGEFNRQKDLLKSELTSQINQFTSIAKDYDSAEDLKDTLKLLTLGGQDQNSTRSFWANRARYDAMYWQDLNVVFQRTTAIRAELMADNESAEKLSRGAADVEGGTSGDAIAGIELARSNMLALINYTELLLQKLKLDVSYDLTQNGFRNTGNATGEINLSNYKYTPQDENYSVGKVELKPAEPGEPVAGSLTEASQGIFEAAVADAQASASETTNSSTSSEDKGENQ